MHSVRFSLMVFGALALGACASGGAAAPAATPATASSAASASIAGAIDPADAPFVGSRKTKVFYPATCGMAKLIKTADRVGFGSIKDAEKAGFSRDVFGNDCR